MALAELAQRSGGLPEVDLAGVRVLFPVLLDGGMVTANPEHLGVGYLVAVLRQAGASCRVVEVSTGRPEPALLDQIADWTPDIIGITLTAVSAAHASQLAAILRARVGPHVLIVVGGPLATFKGKDLLALDGWQSVDALVRGEGEVPILLLAEQWRGVRDLSRVPNLVYRDASELRMTPMLPQLRDLSVLPYPARDQFEIHGRNTAALRIATSRGCTSHCTFCNAPHARNKVASGKLWRGLDPECVVAELELLHRRYQFDTFDFVDSTFEDAGGTARAKQRIRAIAERILQSRLCIYYSCCMQAKNWTEEDRDLLELLHRSGLEKVLVGIESGSDRGLRLWKKLSTVGDNERAIRLLRDAGIYVQFGFIAFHPYSSFDEIRESFAFLGRTAGHLLRKFTTRLELYPGAEIVNTLRLEGLLDEQCFDRSLDPFAYTYRDERIAKLAEHLALLMDAIRDAASDAEEPASFEVEEYDAWLHGHLLRCERLGGARGAADLLARARARVAEIQRDLAAFNLDLVLHCVDGAESCELEPCDIHARAARIEHFHRRQLDALKAVRRHVDIALHREDIDVQRSFRASPAC